MFQVNQLPQEFKATGNGQVSNHSVTAVSSGESINSYYKLSNQNQSNANDDTKAIYSFEQNKQSEFSNQHSQSTQSHITKNVFRGRNNILTETAISHQTRSQSTSSNSQQFQYKFTQNIPYDEPLQYTQSIGSTTKLPYTYIPPQAAQASYSQTMTTASKQLFTYPAVS